MMNKRILISLASATLLLVACGGGSDDPVVVPPPTSEVPALASASSTGLATYLTDLSMASADMLEPVSLTTFAPVQPEDTEPEPVK